MNIGNCVDRLLTICEKYTTWNGSGFPRKKKWWQKKMPGELVQDESLSISPIEKLKSSIL